LTNRRFAAATIVPDERASVWAEPLVAVTSTSSQLPWSAAATVYVERVAPRIAVQP
jgi:hypothetical protein